MTIDTATRWPAVLVLFAGGCTLALHQGKVPSALPVLRDDLGLGLPSLGAIVSLYAVIVMSCGIAAGILVARIGYPLFAIAGVALAGVASVFGGMSDAVVPMLASRALEGAGWLLAAIALPVLITSLTAPADRPLALGLWGAFVPIGAGSMLLVSPGLQALGGWRLSWSVAGGLSVLAAVLVTIVCLRHGPRLARASEGTRPRLRDLRHPGALLMGASFFLYSFQFLAVTSFLPTLLVDRESLDLGFAATLAAGVILCNAIGNVIAGTLLRRGVPFVRVLMVAMVSSSAAGALVYVPGVPVGASTVAAALFSLLGGMIPGTLFASVGRVASVPASTGPLVGLLMQAAGCGQLLGPLALTGLVNARGDWSAGIWIPLVAGVTGVVVILRLARTVPVRSDA